MMFPIIHGLVGASGVVLPPSVQTTATSIEDTNTPNHTITLPSGIVSGDLLIANFAVDASGGDAGISWPGGWMEIFNNMTGAIQLAIAYRQADGTEGATISVTTTNNEKSAHTTYRITGHKDPASQAPEVSTAASGDTTTPDPGSLTPTGGSKPYLWLAVHSHDAEKTTTAFPTNYSNGKSTQGTGGTSAGVGSAERQLTAASEDPGTFTISDQEAWVAATVAVHPA